MTVDQISGHVAERALTELSNVLSRGAVALLVPEFMRRFVENVEKARLNLR